MGNYKDDLAQRVCQDYENLSAQRSNFESHWTEIAQRVIPAHSNFFQSLGQSLMTKGEKRNQFLFDSTAAIALNRFAAILDSLLTPMNQTWHRLVPSDPVLAKNYEVRLWFEEATRVLFKYRYAPKANFASQNSQVFKSLGAYGTGILFIDRLLGQPGLRYRNCHLSEIYLKENHQGMVDGVVRRFSMTARQAYQKWGMKIGEQIRAALNVNAEKEFIFLHAVGPNERIDYGRADFRGWPYSSCYVSYEDKLTLEEGGYRTFPYGVPRYEQASGEVYGRSPAMDTLPAIKTLNEQKKVILKQGHRSVDPVLLTHDDGIINGFSLRPGAMNSGGVSADGRPLVHALPVGNVQVGKELMDDERAVINDAFLVTLFQILVESPQMTATEVIERVKEKGILLGPTVGRQHTEYLGPMIERELEVADTQGLLPPMPPILLEAQGEYKIEYDSPLTRAQRAEEAAGFMRTLETALGVVNVTQDPSPLDHFNFDVIVPDVAMIQGMPAKWTRSDQQVAQIRQQRAEQAQTQTAIEAAPGAAAMMNALTKSRQAPARR